MGLPTSAKTLRKHGHGWNAQIGYGWVPRRGGYDSLAPQEKEKILEPGPPTTAHLAFANPVRRGLMQIKQNRANINVVSKLFCYVNNFGEGGLGESLQVNEERKRQRLIKVLHVIDESGRRGSADPFRVMEESEQQHSATPLEVGGESEQHSKAEAARSDSGLVDESWDTGQRSQGRRVAEQGRCGAETP
ncbi:hypothetical protein NDU88_005102 [Pleurodeles waltl]|uniref:Uncharacterized protein n=1 Tax=Pleurodeles waltl TaxID=8319 RepID=A0AAV7V6Y1_PLEWA|nr:hypothetical protein NDU88_005102 [Pleurodeles waltl]